MTQTPLDARQYLPDGSLKGMQGIAGDTSLSWTPLGELNVLNRVASTGTVRLEFTQDALGRRIRKVVKRGGVRDSFGVGADANRPASCAPTAGRLHRPLQMQRQSRLRPAS